jgi:predicted  nucleic acid-binding Zn-ribbon protein
MPVPRLSCSDPVVPQVAARQPSGGIAIGRADPDQMTDLIRAYLARQQNWLTTHEQDREATTELLKNDVAAGRALIEGPRFARSDASIAKQQLDWPCQHRPDDEGPPGESERMADGPADRDVSARTLRLGGIAFAVLSAAIVSGLATVQAIRPLPFEIWAQRNLIQITDGIPGATTTNAQNPDQLVRGPEGAPNAGSGPVAARNSFIQLHEALMAARERLEELSDAADTVAATGQLQQELAALREENPLVRAEIKARTKEIEQATAKAREMDQELVAVRAQSEQRIAAADAARVEAEARLREIRDSLQRAEQEKARIGAVLVKVQGELATAKEQVAAAGRERTQIAQRTVSLQFERDDLSTRLADATARLGPSEAAKVQLEREVARLRQAARTAAHDTRQLIESLAAIGLAAGPLEADAALLAESGVPSPGEGTDGGGRDAAAPVGNVAAVAASSQGLRPTNPDADLQRRER